jgi:hypothetical protein
LQLVSSNTTINRIPVVVPEKVSVMGWEPALTTNGQVTGGEELGVEAVMVKPLALVDPDHTEEPLKATFFRYLPRVAQITVIELMWISPPVLL